VINRAGGAPVDLLFGTGKKEQNLSEQMTGDLDKARFYKRKEEFDQALRIVNKVIEQDPEFPEALFLKAHIVWEGFENLGMARDCLEKITEVTSV
jgi:tetratricopeptide (TPR) repeat protein